MLPVALGLILDKSTLQTAGYRPPLQSKSRGRAVASRTPAPVHFPDVSLDRALRSADLFRDRRQCGAGFAPVILGVEAVDDEDVARDPRGERRA
jgi:hypothetical protein